MFAPFYFDCGFIDPLEDMPSERIPFSAFPDLKFTHGTGGSVEGDAVSI
jgi:hypothetical protein